MARSVSRAIALASSALACAAMAQAPHDPAAALRAQREAMAPLAAMDGIWRGPAWTLTPSGEKVELVQTERIGSFLGGTLKVIEGRGYRPDGSVGFNALGVVSYDPEKRAYSMRSWAMGRSGDFAFRPTADGYVWEIAAGPATIRYTATIRGGMLHEVGERIVPGRPPARFFEMKLERVGDTDWPAGNPVAPR